MLEGVELVEADRDIFGFLGPRLGELVSRRSPSSPTSSPSPPTARSANGSMLVPAKGVVLGLRAVKEDVELDAIRAAARVTSAAYERLARESVVGRTEARCGLVVREDAAGRGRGRSRVPGHRRRGPNAALPHHHPGDRKIGAWGDDGHRRRRARRRLLLRLHAHVRHRRAPGAAPAGLRPLPFRAGERAGRGAPGRDGAELDAIARDEIEASGPGPRASTARATASAWTCIEPGAVPFLDRRHLHRRQRRHGRAGRVLRRPGRHPDRGSRHRGRGRAGGADYLHRRIWSRSTSH